MELLILFPRSVTGILPRSPWAVRAARDSRHILGRFFRTNTAALSFSRFLKFLVLERKQADVAGSRDDLDKVLPVYRPDIAAIQHPPTTGIRVTWIGHSSLLVQMEGISLLTDPIFSPRCSPVSFMGPKRYRPVPCRISDLPHIDVVLISHNHYDHLDTPSVKQLNKRFGASLKWLVPLGLKRWFLDTNCTNVHELSWWDEHPLSTNNRLPDSPGVIFGCVPAQHWSRRTLLDTGKSLWCGWVVIGRGYRFYFAGDTGYNELFRYIGSRYGPFDLAAIPIGAYSPREIMGRAHVNPAEAVLIHRHVRARWSVGIHWGTFRLSTEPYLEPPLLVKEAMSTMGLDPARFFTLPHGGTRHVDKD